MSNSESREVPTLEELRKRARMSRASLATEVGVGGERTIYAWEREGVIPGPETIVSLAKSLGVSIRGIYESLGFDLSEVPLDEN